MTKHFLFIFPLLFQIGITGYSQNHNIATIKWQKDVKENFYSEQPDTYPAFENSFNLPQWGLMPCYYDKIDIGPLQTIEVSIDEIETDTIFCNNGNTYSDKDVLKTSWQIEIEYLKDKAIIYVLPLKKVKNRIVRLTKFRINKKIIDNGRKPQKSFTPSYTDESILNSGEWYKIGITKTGIHKIEYDDLEAMGINISEIDPHNIRIYGQYNGMLPEANSEPRPDDLVENAIEVKGEQDGNFDKEDLILFFGQGPTTWKFNNMTGSLNHQNNLYSDTIYYFLNFDKGPGKRIINSNQPQEEAGNTITSFINYDVIDNDNINLLSSGKLWFGEVFNKDTASRMFHFSFPNRITTAPVYIRIQVAAKGLENSYFSLFENNNNIIDSALIIGVSPNSRYYAKKISRAKNFLSENKDITLELKFAGDDPLNTGWLNYLEINTECKLKWQGKQLLFSYYSTTGNKDVNKFIIENISGNNEIWDISEKSNIKKQDFNLINDTASFKSNNKPENHFIIFNNSTLYSPVSYKKIENQNLHGTGTTDFVIVAPPFLKQYAEILAFMHQEHDNMKVTVVTPEQIYNEFSSGTQDICAIRDYMRMLYLKGLFEDKPPYLLLFGDGSFDYKNRIPDNTNYIPVFESEESLKKTSTYGTDDFYGLLDDDEGKDAIGNLDVGIGRFPISTIEEANTVLNKIDNYLLSSKKTMQPWRNTICFIADDQDLNLHLNQAESLTKIVDTAYPELNIKKIYIDAFVRESTSAGYRYPDVNNAIDNQVKAGNLIINYTGHGGLDGWAKEKILTLPQIRGYDNLHKLPLFITATCEFSRFDDPEFFSAGEQLFLNEKGGGIALLTTTRLAFASANIILNKRIYRNLKNTEGNELPRLGDLIRLAKTPAHSNFLNFTLLGDPALKLAYPSYNILTESVTNEEDKDVDTITALSKITVKGKIMNNGVVAENFNGYVYPKIFDKKSKYVTRANSPRSIKQQFTFFDKILYKGRVTVNKGHFEFSFFASKELNPEFGKGKLSYYALDTVNFIDATGYNMNIVMGGTNPNAKPDNSGPGINLYINNKNYTDDEAVEKNSLLIGEIFDESGINYTGLGLGHDITITIDNDYVNTINANNLFQIDVDSYKSGKIYYSLLGLSPGNHNIIVKAWDLQGNSSEKEITFFIDDTDNLKMRNFIAYPNPFHDKILFRFESNLQKDAEIRINIYNVNGKKIGEADFNQFLHYNSLIEFDWNNNVKDAGKEKTGLYFYELIIKDTNGSNNRYTGKIIKVNH